MIILDISLWKTPEPSQIALKLKVHTLLSNIHYYVIMCLFSEKKNKVQCITTCWLDTHLWNALCLLIKYTLNRPPLPLFHPQDIGWADLFVTLGAQWGIQKYSHNVQSPLAYAKEQSSLLGFFHTAKENGYEYKVYTIHILWT